MQSFEALITRKNLNPRQTHGLRQLAFLAPNIIQAVIDGNVPDTLTLERLKKDLPIDWQAQREKYNFVIRQFFYYPIKPKQRPLLMK